MEPSMQAEPEKHDNGAQPIPVMQLFILALVSLAGAHTLYQVKRWGGLTYGGIRPSLSALEAEGLLLRSSPKGPLGKKNLYVSSKGRSVLKERWSWGLKLAADEDLETVLRMAWVAQLMDEAAAQDFLRDATEQQNRRQETLARIFEGRVTAAQGKVASYQMLRSELDRARRAAEIKFLRWASAELQRANESEQEREAKRNA